MPGTCMNARMERPFVVVIGGGPAGAVTALELVRRNVDVTVLERGNFCAPRAGEILRPEGIVQLQRLGLWQDFIGSGHLESPGIVSCWGTDVPVAKDFVFGGHGGGWHLNRRAFDAALSLAAQREGVNVACNSQIKSCGRSVDGNWCIQYACDGIEQTLTTPFVVDATGRSAWFARRNGARQLRMDRLVGLLGTVSNHATDDRRLWIEATEGGWWYSAILPDGGLMTALMTDHDQLPRNRAEHQDVWVSSLRKTRYTFERVGANVRIEALRTVPAYTAVTYPVGGDRWLAVGDAALSFDPLSSQGVFKAIESGCRAADSIAGHLAGRPDAISVYKAWTRKILRDYLSGYFGYYGQVLRFDDAPFWRRRHFRSKTYRPVK